MLFFVTAQPIQLKPFVLVFHYFTFYILFIILTTFNFYGYRNQNLMWSISKAQQTMKHNINNLYPLKSSHHTQIIIITSPFPGQSLKISSNKINMPVSVGWEPSINHFDGLMVSSNTLASSASNSLTLEGPEKKDNWRNGVYEI